MHPGHLDFSLPSITTTSSPSPLLPLLLLPSLPFFFVFFFFFAGTAQGGLGASVPSASAAHQLRRCPGGLGPGPRALRRGAAPAPPAPPAPPTRPPARPAAPRPARHGPRPRPPARRAPDLPRHGRLDRAAPAPPPRAQVRRPVAMAAMSPHPPRQVCRGGGGGLSPSGAAPARARRPGGGVVDAAAEVGRSALQCCLGNQCSQLRNWLQCVPMAHRCPAVALSTKPQVPRAGACSCSGCQANCALRSSSGVRRHAASRWRGLHFLPLYGAGAGVTTGNMANVGAAACCVFFC